MNGDARAHTTAIDELLAKVRLAAFRFVVATGRNDNGRAKMAAARLRWALSAAQQLALHAPGSEVQEKELQSLALTWRDAANRQPLTCEDLEAMLGCKDAGPFVSDIDGSGLDLLAIDLHRLEIPRVRLVGAKLVDVRMSGAILDAADLGAAHLVRCQLDACALASAVFDRITLDGCDLARSAFSRSSWQGAAARTCSFAGADLVDTRLDLATFSDCSFRGANLATRGRGAAMRGSRFVRCDLRETDWSGRDLSGVTFIACAFYGAHGAPTIGNVVIEGPDLSASADGSQLGGRGDVVARWATFVSLRERDAKAPLVDGADAIRSPRTNGNR